MIHTVLFTFSGVLKALGIILLVLIGLVLVLLCLVLFVPLRYRLDGVFSGEKKSAVFRLTWLFHLISLRASYETDDQIRAYILGIPVFPRKEKKQTSKKREREENAGEKCGEPEETEDCSGEPASLMGETDGQARTSGTESGKEEERDIVSGIRETIRLWRNVCGDKVQGFLNGLKESGIAVGALKTKAERFAAFLQEETTKTSASLIKTRLFTILKHIKPKHIKGRLRFGASDPAVTGQILGAVSIIYGCFPEQVQLEPDFTRAVLEGELCVRGHIRLIHFGIGGAALFINRDLRAMIKSGQSLRQE